MSPAGVVILFFALTLVVFSAPRRWAMVGSMVGILFLTQGQNIQIGGFNLYAVRVMEFSGFIRVVMRRELTLSMLNNIDRALLLLYAYTTVVFLIRSPDGQANQVGIALDAILTYFMYRGLVGDIDDFKWFLVSLLGLLTPYTILVLIESFTRHNPFASMGGVILYNWIRDGRLRCQGSFRHPSLLGTLGASFLPIYIGLALSKQNRRAAWLGILLCLLIIWASNSGGPANFAAVAILGWLLWPLRTRMKLIRRTVAVALIVLAFAMKAPIWYILAKASSLSGGDGWHRSYLIDITYHNLDKWWLTGMALRDTKDWFPYDLEATGGADITNLFLSFALTAGIIAMFLFIALLVKVFSRLGRALQAARTSGNQPEGTEYLLWGLGVMLVGHIFNWLGITYFDQTYAIWFMQLAAISNLADHCIRRGEAAEYDDIPELEDLHEGMHPEAMDTPVFPEAQIAVCSRISGN